MISGNLQPLEPSSPRADADWIPTPIWKFIRWLAITPSQSFPH